MKKANFNDLKTFSIITLGCKVNTYESNIIQNDLLSLGLIKVPFGEKADLSIINTCSVTNTADSKSKNMINRASNKNPDTIVLVCGCYSQVASNSLKNDYGIDILLGNKYKNNIVEILNNFFKEKNKQLIKIDNLLLEKDFEDSRIDIFKEKTRAFVKIQDGCNYMCSYCIIPFTRGKQRSKDFDKLINEIKILVKNNYKEIVLTGVNTAGYVSNDKSFYDLLLAINELDGNFRVRISSLEPFQISDNIIKLICTNSKRFAQHWHICLQSGSDSVLKQMNRKYTTEQFFSLISKIYKFNNLSSISTDYICGFPTESNIDHLNSIEFIKKIEFSKIHVFPYSKRSFTPAAKLKQIHDQEKSNRVKDILTLNDTLQTNFLKKFINKTVEVLFEKFENNVNTGYCGEYFIVHVKSNIDYTNTLKKVIIRRVIFNETFGEILKK